MTYFIYTLSSSEHMRRIWKDKILPLTLEEKKLYGIQQTPIWYPANNLSDIVLMTFVHLNKAYFSQAINIFPKSWKKEQQKIILYSPIFKGTYLKV